MKNLNFIKTKLILSLSLMAGLTIVSSTLFADSNTNRPIYVSYQMIVPPQTLAAYVVVNPNNADEKMNGTITTTEQIDGVIIRDIEKKGYLVQSIPVDNNKKITLGEIMRNIEDGALWLHFRSRAEIIDTDEGYKMVASSGFELAVKDESEKIGFQFRVLHSFLTKREQELTVFNLHKDTDPLHAVGLTFYKALKYFPAAITTTINKTRIGLRHQAWKISTQSSNNLYTKNEH